MRTKNRFITILLSTAFLGTSIALASPASAAPYSLGPYDSQIECKDDQNFLANDGYSISRSCYATHWGWFFSVAQ